MIRTRHREYDYERRHFVEVWRTWDPERLAYRKVDAPPVMVRGFDWDDVSLRAAKAFADAIATLGTTLEAVAKAMAGIKWERIDIGAAVDQLYVDEGWQRHPPRYDPRHLAGWPNYAEASPPEGSRWTPWGYTGMPDGWHGGGGD